MSETTTATETKTETIATQQEVDYEALLKQKNEELAQVAKEKENYRKAYLKNVKPEEKESDSSSPEDMEAFIERKVQEKFLATKEAQLQAEKDLAITGLARRNKELEVALKNRGQITSTSAGGSNLDKPEVNTNPYFSNEQIQAFKAKGWSDEKIEMAKKNMQKITQGALITK